MRKKIIIAATIITIVSTLIIANVGESEKFIGEKKNSNIEVKSKMLNFYEYKAKMKDEVKRVAEVKEQEENKIEKNKRPILAVKIPLSDEILDYIFEQSEVYEIPYTLVLSVMNVESEFEKDEISPTKDYGLMQISHRNIKWISEELGIGNPKPLDEKQNVLMGIWYLRHVKDYWSEKGIPDEQMFTIMCLSYNRGLMGARNWIRQHGWDNDYVNKVLEYKEMLERNVVDD
jgi:soluble lytic murein transglycosylase-like protein